MRDSCGEERGLLPACDPTGRCSVMSAHDAKEALEEVVCTVRFTKYGGGETREEAKAECVCLRLVSPSLLLSCSDGSFLLFFSAFTFITSMLLLAPLSPLAPPLLFPCLSSSHPCPSPLRSLPFPPLSPPFPPRSPASPLPPSLPSLSPSPPSSSLLFFLHRFTAILEISRACRWTRNSLQYAVNFSVQSSTATAR
eukprot:440095-Hanusia_phi.AAC.1